jgi:hypothetical protein
MNNTLERGANVKIKAGIVQITPRMAREWLAEYRYEFQRVIRPTHVEYLASEMIAGRFEVCQITFCDFNGRLFLVDGQHRLHAIANSGTPIEQFVYTEPANSFDEVAENYYRRDIGITRSEADMHKPAQLEKRTGLTPTKICAVSSAAKLIMGGFAPGVFSVKLPYQRSRDIRKNAILDLSDSATVYFESIYDNSTLIQKALLRFACVSVGIVTSRYAPEIATAFWKEVALNDGLRKGAPAKALIESYLLRPTNNLSPAYQARLIAAAWNAYYEKRGLSHLVLTKETMIRPIRICGTPYNGKKVLKWTPGYEPVDQNEEE